MCSVGGFTELGAGFMFKRSSGDGEPAEEVGGRLGRRTLGGRTLNTQMA